MESTLQQVQGSHSIRGVSRVSDRQMKHFRFGEVLKRPNGAAAGPESQPAMGIDPNRVLPDVSRADKIVHKLLIR